MSHRLLVGVFAGAFVLLLVVLAPVQLLTGRLTESGAPLSASRAEGTVWRGRLENARLGPKVFGDLKLALSPLALLAGRFEVDVRGAASRGERARLLLSGKTRGARGVQLAAPVDLTRAGLPLAGTLTTDKVAAVFRQGRCVEAGGRLRLRIESAGVLQGAALDGAATCEAGAWVATLRGPTTIGQASLVARVSGNGRLHARFAIAATDPMIVQQLTAQGFVVDATGVARAAEVSLLGR